MQNYIGAGTAALGKQTGVQNAMLELLGMGGGNSGGGGGQQFGPVVSGGGGSSLTGTAKSQYDALTNPNDPNYGNMLMPFDSRVMMAAQLSRENPQVIAQRLAAADPAQAMNTQQFTNAVRAAGIDPATKSFITPVQNPNGQGSMAAPVSTTGAAPSTAPTGTAGPGPANTLAAPATAGGAAAGGPITGPNGVQYNPGTETSGNIGINYANEVGSPPGSLTAINTTALHKNPAISSADPNRSQTILDNMGYANGGTGVNGTATTGTVGGTPNDSAVGGGAGGGANSAFQNYLNSTGYQFRLGQGIGAIEGSQAVGGALNSGATLRALTKYGQNLGSAEFTNYLNQLGNMNNILGATAAAGQTGLGQIATVGTAGGGQAANAIMQGASNQGAAIMQGGNAMANGIAGLAGGIGNTLGQMSSGSSWW